MLSAALWYEREEPELGERFLDAVQDTLDLIDLFPGVGAPRPERPTLRGLRVRRFPYVLIYLEGSPYQIYAVAHTRREPAYWVPRLSGPKPTEGNPS